MNTLLVQRLFSTFKEEDFDTVINELTKSTQSKFTANTSPDEMLKLHQELKAIALLGGLFRKWTNNFASNQGE